MTTEAALRAWAEGSRTSEAPPEVWLRAYKHRRLLRL